MSKRKDPVARARGRSTAPVKKPFPLGFVVGATTLVLALAAILYYAAQHQGLGDKSSLTYARSQISGLINRSGLSRGHTDNPVSYPDQKQVPPVGGEHNGNAESCQVYTQPIANEHAVHSLEHGAVWVTYNPDTLPAADVAKLKALVNGDPYRMMSPYPGLKSPISLQAWGEQLFVDKVTDSRIQRFLDLFTSGPQSPERGSACQGTTATGPLTASAPLPGQSTMPSAVHTSPSP
jgi:hypothetical protein